MRFLADTEPENHVHDSPDPLKYHVDLSDRGSDFLDVLHKMGGESGGPYSEKDINAALSQSLTLWQSKGVQLSKQHPLTDEIVCIALSAVDVPQSEEASLSVEYAPTKAEHLFLVK
jgi:hypothetical protein